MTNTTSEAAQLPDEQQTDERIEALKAYIAELHEVVNRPQGTNSVLPALGPRSAGLHLQRT